MTKGSIATVVAVFIFSGIVVYDKFRPYDDSDAPPMRSGMLVYTDYMTGCQYLRASGGVLTPRMSNDGKQICKDQPK